MKKIKRTDATIQKKTRGVPPRTRSRTLRLNEASSRFIIDSKGGAISQELAAKLSPSIVSLVSFDGKKIHSRCTGIVVHSGQVGASIATSGDLVTSRDLVAAERSGLIDTLKIQVHLPNGKVLSYAYVQDYIVARNILVVATEPFPDFRTACLDTQTQVEPSTPLLAASLCHMSDKFLVTTGVLTDSPIGAENHGSMWSTCKITEAGSGGPLVDFDGNVVGMNLCMAEGITPFVPAKWIAECMVDLGLWFFKK